MMRKVFLRRVLPLCLALAIITVVLVVVFSEKQHGADGGVNQHSKGIIPSLISEVMSIFNSEARIESDGLAYPVSALKDVQIITETVEDNLLPVVGDRETLLKLLLERGVLYEGSPQDYYNSRDYDSSGVIRSEVAAPTAPMSSSAPEEAPAMAIAPEVAVEDGSGSYYQTNEQVEGVSEGDIVKTDGQYIYIMSPSGNSLRIVRADGSRLDVVSTIKYGGTQGSEFYLIGGDRLAIVGSEYVPITMLPALYEDAEILSSQDNTAPYRNDLSSHDFTNLLIYDITDRADPIETRRISMDGYSVSTRVIGNVVYLVTNKYMWGIAYDQAGSQSILPYCLDAIDSNGYKPFTYDRIYYIPDTEDSSYMMIGAVDVYRDDLFEPYAYLGAGSNLYMSQNAMYVTKSRYGQSINGTGQRWSAWREMTDIMRFSVNGTSISYTGMGTVDGTPINQYSMDEYDGYFRIATTDWEKGTYVTVLDASGMQAVGRTEPMAPGEIMRSARFMGDTGYVVTFQNMDPLFTIDLSDPYNPAIMGELKIPGFSQYLHPIGDGLMLGIGRDTQEIYSRDTFGNEIVIGFRDVGMKVSLFDVSDPFDPKEIDVLPLGEGWAEVCDNPRALMSDHTHNLYGFFMENWNSYDWPTNALLFRVENRRLTVAVSLEAREYSSMYESRLCFIGDTLYLINSSGIDAYDYTTFKRLGRYNFYE